MYVRKTPFTHRQWHDSWCRNLMQQWHCHESFLNKDYHKILIGSIEFLRSFGPTMLTHFNSHAIFTRQKHYIDNWHSIEFNTHNRNRTSFFKREKRECLFVCIIVYERCVYIWQKMAIKNASIPLAEHIFTFLTKQDKCQRLK